MDEVYLRISPSSEKRGKFYVIFLNSPTSMRQIGFLSRYGKKCMDLDRYQTDDDDLGAYFDSKEEALECITQFYKAEEYIDL